MLNINKRELEEKYCCLIPDKRIRIWNIQMELWQEFDRICQKYNLKYFFMWGALLGAVRHQGFIPWDDDIDVVMPREDYNQFMQAALSELKEPYYAQVPQTNGKANYMICKIINEHTTCINMACQTVYNHQGISLDIVPLDGTSENRMKRKFQIIQHEALRILMNNYHIQWSKISLQKKIVKLISVIYFAFRSYENAAEALEKIRSRYKWEEGSMVAEFAHGVRFPKEWFSASKELRFEGYGVPVPCEYEKVLEKLYGDYMKLPKFENRIVSESDMAGWITEPDISYKSYLKIKNTPPKNYQLALYHNFVDD